MRLDGPASGLPESSRKRLRGSWAETFRKKVLPVLLNAETDFADAYDASTGRPNWSVARLLSILLMQELRGLSDQEALDELAFDVRWQYALDLPLDEAYLSRRSLVEFRSRVVEQDPEMVRLRKLFLAVTEAALKELRVTFEEQRLDSTHVMSNIRTRGRADLFAKTLRHFLVELKERRPQHFLRLSETLRRWFERSEEGWFGAGKRDEDRYRKRLQQLAGFLHEVVSTFEKDHDVCGSERYALVARVLREHCELRAGSMPEGSANTRGNSGTPTDGTEPLSEGQEPSVQLRKKLESPGSHLQSPFDPDATYGHKGVGYSVHLVETCRNEGTELLTDYEVLPAGPDQDKAPAIIERLKTNGLQPRVLYADAGYGSGSTIEQIGQMGTDFMAPVPRGRTVQDVIGREQFRFDDAGQVMACPAGHTPLRHGFRRSESERGERTLNAFFNAATCRACPLGNRCVAKGPDNGKSGCFNLELTTKQRLRDQRLAEQNTSAFRDRYAVRAGIEATNSELKRVHRMERLRVRRLPRVRMAVAFKVMACNIKRWARVAALAPAILLALLVSIGAGRPQRPAFRLRLLAR